jgi:hypothetical protein
MPVRWTGGRVAVEDSVAMSGPVAGTALRDSFRADIQALTLGIVRADGNSLRIGPLELIRFGPARVTRTSVQWPIEGGLLARARGGRLRIETLHGRLVASVDGYQPALPRPIYLVTQLPVHHLWTRLHLLRVRGRKPLPGTPARQTRRLTAAAVDVGICLALAAALGRHRRFPTLLGIVAGYHAACWKVSGQTVGGALMKQRVLSVDGSGVSAGQAIVRMASLPFSILRMRNVHDEIAGTEVVGD